MTYGNVNVDTVTTSTSGGVLGAGDASIMKNRIINGAMVIDQRNAGASVTPATTYQYTLDRWEFTVTQASKLTTQQNAGSVTPPVGFTKYLGVTSSSAYSVNSTDRFNITQYIEGYNVADLAWGTASAKTVTLSFQVYSSLTGTFGGSVIAQSGSPQYYPFSYTISSANTWTQISVTVPGNTNVAINTTTSTGVILQFGLGVGSTYSGTAGSWSSTEYRSSTGAVSVVGTNGATFYITGVQLEVGSSATGYEYRQYTQELSLCQRYYTRMANNGASGAATFASGNIVGSTDARISLTLPTTMRSAPTINYANMRLYDGSAASPITSIAQSQALTTIYAGQFTASAGSFTIGRGANMIQSAGDTTCYIDASAEL